MRLNARKTLSRPKNGHIIYILYHDSANESYSWLMNASAHTGLDFYLFFQYFLTSLAQYFISRLETTQVRSSRAVYETYEQNDALLVMTPALTPSQNRPHALCASQQPRTRSACIDAHGRDIKQHKHRHPLCIQQTSSQHDK